QGPSYFMRALAAGTPYTSLVTQFTNSPYAQSYTNVDDMENINALYRTMLGQVGDPVTMYEAILQMEKGTTLGTIAGNINSSSAHQAIGANTYYTTPFVEWYRAILNRMPSNAELVTAMTSVLNGTTSYTQWINNLSNSQEAQSIGGKNAENIIALY